MPRLEPAINEMTDAVGLLIFYLLGGVDYFLARTCLFVTFIPLFAFCTVIYEKNHKTGDCKWLQFDLGIFHRDPDLSLVFGDEDCDSMGVSEDSEGVLFRTEPQSLR